MKKISEEEKKNLRKESKSDFLENMSIMSSEEKIETDNLILKHFTTRSSREFYKEVITNIECTRFIQNSWIGEVKTFEDWNLRVDNYDNFWLIQNKTDKQIIGCIEVENNYLVTEISSAQIIWFVKEDFSQEPFFVEAIKAIVIEYFENREFFESAYDFMEIKINEKHPGAAAICEKAGFTKEGVLRNRCVDRKTGEKCNVEIWSILREEI